MRKEEASLRVCGKICANDEFDVLGSAGNPISADYGKQNRLPTRSIWYKIKRS